MKYIIDKNNRVMGTIDSGNPDLKDLETRGEFIVEQDEVIDLAEAEYKNGKVVRRIISPGKADEEIQAERKARFAKCKKDPERIQLLAEYLGLK